MAHNGQQHPMG